MKLNLQAHFLAVFLLAGAALAVPKQSRATEPAAFPTSPLWGANPLVPPGVTSAENVIGVFGGSVFLGGLTLFFPPGALASDTLIRVTILDEPSPPGFKLFSALYRVEPSGIVFSERVEFAIPFSGEHAGATLYGAAQGGTFERARGFVDKSLAVVDLLVGPIAHGGVYFVADKSNTSDAAPLASCGCGDNTLLTILDEWR